MMVFKLYTHIFYSHQCEGDMKEGVKVLKENKTCDQFLCNPL